MNSVSVINTLKTMTSREIAELTGKRHDNVIRDIRAMLTELHGEGGVLRFEETYTNHQNGQSYPVFSLPKEETLCLVAGYNTAMRMAIIRRWQELEASTPVLPNFSDPVAAARAWADAKESEQKALVLLEAAKPAIAFSERHQDATNLMSIRAAAKIMKFKEVRFIDCLLRDRLLYRDRQQRLVPYASTQHEKQIFDCVTGEANGHAYAQTKVTTYGIQYLSSRYASELGE